MVQSSGFSIFKVKIILCLICALLTLKSYSKSSTNLSALYDTAIEGDTSVVVRFNNYLIFVENEKIAKAQRGAQLDLELRAGVTQGSRSGQIQSSDAGFTFFLPIYDFQKAVAQSRSQASSFLAKLESEAQRQNFTQLFLEAFIRLSERKSQYYFAIAKDEFLKRFYLKIEKDAEKNFREQHPDLPFDSKKVLVLRLIRQELEDQSRVIRGALLEYINEKNFIEKSLIGAKIPDEQLLHPFLKIKIINEDPDELVKRIKRNNLSLQALLAGVNVADLNLLAASKAWQPTLGLYGDARFGIESGPGSSSPGSYNEFGGGVSLRWRLSGRKERKAKEEIARLEKVNKQAEYDGLLVDNIVELHRLRNGLNTQKEQIYSLLESYKESKETLELFLGKDKLAMIQSDIVEPATIPEKRSIVESHFRVAEKLVIAQHNLILLDFRMRLLTGQMNRGVVDSFGKNLLVNCRDFKEFLDLDKVLMP